MYLFKTSKLTKGKILLLLPSADPLSIELIKTISKFHFARKFCIRIRMVGSESRGVLGHETIYKDLIQVQSTDKIDLQIGFETQAYADFLVKKGIDYNRLRYQGFSNNLLLVSPEKTEADREKNRRVDIIFSIKSKTE